MLDRDTKFLRFHPLLILALLVFGNASFAGQRGLPPQQGILNFGKIDAGVYRGAVPDTAAISRLHELGIKTIIDLQMPNRVWKAEESEARARGILYTNLPLHGLSRPTDEQVRGALALIETLPGPVFIHCQHGCDRTGTIIACYRIKHDHWSRQTALQEAARYGMSWLERGMKNFVVEFSKVSTQLAKN